ncbi:MAG TPA: hypothetical protein VHS28_10890, partial [Chloroflexota bacterium]|nr:hypothetical protein [Chloroflexota bacterium]
MTTLSQLTDQPSTRQVKKTVTWVSLGACGGLVVALAIINYILWVHNYFAADSWSLIGSISEPDWSLADLLPFRRVPHAVNSTEYYAPVFTVVLWVAYKLGGFAPERYHLMLIGFHAGTSLFVFLSAFQLTRSRLKATAAGAIFAVHFASVEAVGWIGGITHPLAGFFGALSMVLYLYYMSSGRRILGLGAFLALLGASFTQVTALPWFAILACIDIYYSRCGTSPVKSSLIRRLALLAVLLLAILPMQFQSFRVTGTDGYQYRIGSWILLNAFFYPLSTVMPNLEGPAYSLVRDLLEAPFEPHAFTRLMTMNDAFGMLLASGLAIAAIVLLWLIGGRVSRLCIICFALATTPFLLMSGQGYRYLYPLLMFFSIAFAGALVDLSRHLRGASRWGSYAVLTVLPLFVLLSFAESQRQLFWWEQAGLITHKSLNQLKETQPEFPKSSKVVFGGLVDTLQDTSAQVWRRGISEAVKV